MFGIQNDLANKIIDIDNKDREEQDALWRAITIWCGLKNSSKMEISDHQERHHSFLKKEDGLYKVEYEICLEFKKKKEVGRKPSPKKEDDIFEACELVNNLSPESTQE